MVEWLLALLGTGYYLYREAFARVTQPDVAIKRSRKVLVLIVLEVLVIGGFLTWLARPICQRVLSQKCDYRLLGVVPCWAFDYPIGCSDIRPAGDRAGNHPPSPLARPAHHGVCLAAGRSVMGERKRGIPEEPKQSPMNPALCVVTTIGTSLLSNLAGQGDAADLREASNLAEEELSPGQRRTIDEITAKARDALGEADPGKDRFLRACAELEGLHALCGDRLTTNEGRYDLHYLIATDTALGHRIGELIASSLRRMGQNVELVVPVGLSTRSQASFIAGLRRVVRWCESTLVGQRETGRRVVFHLSGGFKSLLGALNLVGMFYADEVAYRFEGPGAPLIRNPSLPLAVRLDLSAPELALLAVLAECDGLSVRAERVAGWPAALVDADGHGRASISPWGLLAWYDNSARSSKRGCSRFPDSASSRPSRAELVPC